MSRDFTINALYADRDGCVYDPLDRGFRDIAKLCLETIVDSNVSMKNDAVRILRAVYFTTALRLTVNANLLTMHPELEQAIVKNLDGLQQKGLEGKLNSWFSKVFCRSGRVNIVHNFSLFNRLGVLDVLFPDLAVALNKNLAIKRWVDSVLSGIEQNKVRPSINYLYAVFAVAMAEQSGCAIDVHIENTPLLKVNFSDYRSAKVAECESARQSWLQFINAVSAVTVNVNMQFNGPANFFYVAANPQKQPDYPSPQPSPAGR